MRTKILMMFLGLMYLSFNQNVNGQEVDQKEVPLVVRIYDVSDLVAADYTPSYSSKSWPGTGMFRSEAGLSGGFGFGGVGGVGGSGGGGGGGLFAVPPQSLGMGAQGGGMGGARGGMGRMGGASGDEFDLVAEGMKLQNLVQSSVDAMSWETMGGRQGVNCNFYNGHLVVSHSEASHQHIEEFLKLLRAAKSNSKVIQMDWMAVKADQANMSDLSNADQEAKNKFLQEAWVQRGGVSTLNGRVGFTTAAEHRNLVISVTPVVGAGGTQDDSFKMNGRVGYSPTTVKPALGWLVQLRPLVPPGDDPIAHIQVGASFTSAPESATTNQGQVDRGNVNSLQVGGLAKAKANQWVVVGGMGNDAAKASDGRKQQDQFYILVRWSEVKGE